MCGGLGVEGGWVGEGVVVKGCGSRVKSVREITSPHSSTASQRSLDEGCRGD